MRPLPKQEITVHQAIEGLRVQFAKESRKTSKDAQGDYGVALPFQVSTLWALHQLRKSVSMSFAMI